MNDTIKEIAELIRTQDNACTEEPIYTVQSRRRIYGMDGDYGKQYDWINEGQDFEAVTDPEEVKRLEDLDDSGEETEGYSKVYYIDIWEHKTSCLTRKAAEGYIERMGHHMTDARIYVESGWRNKEWIALREYLKTL